MTQQKVSAAFLKELAYIYSNTNRWDLEAVGISMSDDRWKRFNHNFDIFILKLNDNERERLAAFINARLCGAAEIAEARA